MVSQEHLDKCVLCIVAVGDETCGAQSEDGFWCTRPVGHVGNHVACGAAGHDYERW